MSNQLRKFALLAALLCAALPARALAQADDDDEAPAPAPAQAPTPAQTPAPTPAPAKPGATPGEAKPATPKPAARVKTSSDTATDEEKPAADELHPARNRPAPVVAPSTVDQGYLEGRAEVESPNEAIHTVEKKEYTAANRFEASLYGAAQLNSKFTNTDGFAIAVDYAVQENFALQILGFWNPAAGWAALNGELLDLHARPLAADQLYLTAGAIGGFEVSPLYGKFAFNQDTLAQFRFVLNAGAGIGLSEVQLSAPTGGSPNNATSYGSTGLRFLGNLGAGFRVLLSERFALRLEVRDLLYTARVDTIDGCNATDVTNASAGMGPVSSGCNTGNFAPAMGNEGNTHKSAAQIASNLLKDNSSDVVNDVIFLAGLSYLF